MNAPLISVVIVTWNCRKFAEECLESLRAHLHVPSEIIVVDNASTDGTAKMIERQFPDVRLIHSGGNLGFSKGNNLGIRACGGRYLALINPDVKLLDGCFDQALETLERDPSIGVLGPAMIGRDGQVHRSGMRFPSLWNSLCDALALHAILGPSRAVGGQFMAEFHWDHTREVDILNGWFWLIRREALDQVGLLDEQFFMYGEDLDWCRRFRNAGWRLVFDAQASAIHYGGGSSEQAPTRFYLEMQRANLQYWEKHHGHVSRLLYGAVLWLHNFVRMVGYALLSIARQRQGQGADKMCLYAACLRYLLTGNSREVRGS